MSGGPDEWDARRGAKESTAQAAENEAQELVDGLHELLDDSGSG